MNGQIVVIGIGVRIRCEEKPTEVSHPAYPSQCCRLPLRGNNAAAATEREGITPRELWRNILRLNQYVERPGLIVMIGKTQSTGSKLKAVGDTDALQ